MPKIFITVQSTCQLFVCFFYFNTEGHWSELEWCITVCYMYDVQVGLSILIRRASTMSPAVKLIVQKFVPFPAVGQLVDILPRLISVLYY